MARSTRAGGKAWEDPARLGIRIVNREKGAGSRILLDEHLRMAAIDARPMRTFMGILETDILKEEFSFLGGYDPSDMGKIMWMG